MPTTSRTKPGTRKLSDSARHIVRPSGIVSTGWSAVREKCRKLGLTFDPWQDGAGRLILAKREDGMYAAAIGGVVLSIPRQVGKTFLVGAITVALCLLNPGLLVIWTAHQLPTAGETFRDMQGMVKQPKVAPYVDAIRVGSGDWEIRFRNGSRILFGARERGFGLGFKKVGLIVLDECQRLTEKTLDDLVPTMNQAVNPLLFMMGTPPRPTDAGEVFKARRRDALSGESDDMLYIEMSASPDVRMDTWPKGSVADWDAVAEANPSFPHRTPKRAILTMRKQLTPESFRREALGIWDSDLAGSRAIPADVWKDTGITEAPQDGVRTFGVAFSLEGSRVSTAGAVKHKDGVHAELIAAHTGPLHAGIDPLADWLAARWRTTALIGISGRAGAAALKQALRDRGVPERAIHILSTPDYFAANTMTLDALRGRTLTHPAEVEGDALSASVAISDRKSRGQDGQWGWTATVPDGDETPIEAYSVAHWAARTTKRRPGRTQVLV